MSEIRVAELFAGVGGFRIGFDSANDKLGRNIYNVVWSNQWEPGTKTQHASDVYVRAFGAEGHTNVDIATVPANSIPAVDLVVGGFPCQDYSVANTLQRANGLLGKKGVLWWEIHRLLAEMPQRPPYVLLENVDRLLKSPASHRGRDFAIMLASLSDLGYAVDWRVINAADYGMPQRRVRVFIFAYLEGTPAFQARTDAASPANWISETGIFSRAFPVEELPFDCESTYELTGSPADITNQYEAKKRTPFLNSGTMLNRIACSSNLTARYAGAKMTLGDVLVADDAVPEEYFLNGDLDQWEFLKGAKSLKRVNKSTGHEYNYSEGAMTYPDDLNRPSRTIVTGEGGISPSRFKHVVTTQSGRYRRLLPVELERLNMFPDEHTAGVPDARRAFLMGNALVTGIVERLGVELQVWLDECVVGGVALRASEHGQLVAGS